MNNGHGTAFFEVFESPCDVEPLLDQCKKVPSATVVGTDTRRSQRKKKKSTVEDRVYRSDREYVKRHSHGKMIWFFRNVGLRHAAAIRTHLERVKHPEFDLPNLQCVFPHPELSVGFYEDFEKQPSFKSRRVDEGEAGKAKGGEISSTLSYYNLYCATTALVERVKNMMGVPQTNDTDYNKKVLTFIADIVGRLLWHSRRIHSVMFAKSDHYDRECFLLYSRQAEPTPTMMRSDSYFCRRHDSEKFRCLAPQPDLTRANSSRLSNESSIYVVGCNVSELWDGFDYEYRVTNCRPARPLCESIMSIDPSVLEYTFTATRNYVNGDREKSPYVDVAAKNSFDVLSVLLRDGDLKGCTADDSPAYRNFLERFVTLGILNLRAIWKSQCVDNARLGTTPTKRLDQIVLHHVGYRREVRSLRTNRVYYFRNRDGFICSLSLLDDAYEERAVLEDLGEDKSRVVYFYDVLQPFEYVGENGDVNRLAMGLWEDAKTTIHESAHTVGKRITADTLKEPLPEDPFYPKSNMSPTDIAIDRMLERAIRHSKRLKLSTPVNTRRLSKKKSSRRPSNESREPELPLGLSIDHNEGVETDVVFRSLSSRGENRLRDGFVSPPRVNFETVVEHDGQRFPVKITVDGEREKNECGGTRPVDYGPKPELLVDEGLVCVYVIDHKATKQIRILPGSRIVNRDHREYLPLAITDRIVRVFTVRAMNEDNNYLLKPYVYFVFRNMPIADLEDSTAEELIEAMNSYEDLEVVVDPLVKSEVQPTAVLDVMEELNMLLQLQNHSQSFEISGGEAQRPQLDTSTLLFHQPDSKTYA